MARANRSGPGFGARRRRPDVHRPAQPRGPRDILIPAPSHRPDHGPGQRRRGPAVQPSRGQRVHRQVPAQHGPGEAEASGRHVHDPPEACLPERGSWEHVHYTRPEADQAEAVITWHGDLIRSYAIQAASEKVTRLANETITMLREKREKVVKEDGSIAARNVIARLGKSELRTDAALREQVLDVLVVHRHLIPTARRGHYMMVVPHD